jgi:hypothetical protein
VLSAFHRRITEGVQSIEIGIRTKIVESCQMTARWNLLDLLSGPCECRIELGAVFRTFELKEAASLAEIVYGGCDGRDFG